MKVAIIGAAGSLGSSTAFFVAISQLVEEIVMIDPRENFLLAHANDISNAVTGLDIVVRAGKKEDLVGSDIILVTAGAARGVVSSRRELLPHNLPIILEIAEMIGKYAPNAVIITATIPVEAINYGLYLLTGMDRHRLLGYAVNDSIRFRRMVSQAFGIPSSLVEGTVIGEHGDSQVLLFSSVKVAGRPLSVGEDVKRSIRKQIPIKIRAHQALRTGLTSGWTSAVGFAAMVRAISQDTHEVIPCSVLLDGEYGYRNVSMTVPVELGKNGVFRILEWKLASDEQELLAHSVEILKGDMRYVEEALG